MEARGTRVRRKVAWWVVGVVAGLGFTLALALGGDRVARAAPPAVAVPERTRVCMVQDTVMTVPAVPLARDGKTYYGCCEMCKAKIAADPERYTKARDPVSGAVVDKATASLLSVDGRVLYFESADTRTRYTRRLTGNP
jgi:YHS domain-containing protein